MPPTTTPSGENLATRFPALTALGLGAAEIGVLERQGFLREDRHGAQLRFKLRFRLDGGQRARCVPAKLVPAVRLELNELQAGTKLAQRVGRNVRAARVALRQTKQQLGPHVRELGLVFHGHELRRPRTTNISKSLGVIEKE
jgi:hypothetical protein